MKRRLFLLILLISGCMSLASFFSILYFFDPYQYGFIAPLFLAVSFIGVLVWIGSLGFYFCKKIYYRGDVNISNILTSMRQTFFLSCIFLSYVISGYFWVPTLVPVLWVALFLLSFELLLQSFLHSS